MGTHNFYHLVTEHFCIFTKKFSQENSPARNEGAAVAMAVMGDDPVEEDTTNYQREGVCGVPKIQHNPALFIGLPNHRKKRNAFGGDGSRFSFASLLGAPAAPVISPAAAAPAHAGNGGKNRGNKNQHSAPAQEIHISNRIVGGNEAAPHSWPWTAHIVTGKSRGARKTCGLLYKLNSNSSYYIT